MIRMLRQMMLAVMMATIGLTPIGAAYAQNTTLTQELNNRGVKPLTPANIDAAGGDPTARTSRIDGFGATMQTLQAGYSAADTLLGDSTGANLGDFFQASAALIAAYVPGDQVEYRLWRSGTQEYDPRVVVQAGTIARNGVAGDEHLYFDFTNGLERTRRLSKSEMITPTSTGVDVRFDVALTSYTNSLTLLSQYFSATDLIQVKIAGGGKLRLQTSSGGVVATSDSTIAIPTSAGVRTLLRVTAAPGGFVRFYTADPATEIWTQLGADVAAPAAFQVETIGTIDWALAGRGPGTNTEGMSGSYYSVEIRDGVDGPIRNPQPIDTWRRSNITDANVLRGSPTLRMFAGSQSGSTVDQYDAVRVARALRPYNDRNHIITNFGHNHSLEMASTFLGKYDTFLGLVKARSPYSPITVTRQNPTKAPWSVAEDTLRGFAIPGYAARNGYDFLDNFTPLAKLGDYSGKLDINGVHPTSAQRATGDATVYPQPYGSDILAAAFAKRFGRWVPISYTAAPTIPGAKNDNARSAMAA